MPESLLRRYEPNASRHDEMLDLSRAPRPHWRALLSQLAALSREALLERNRFVQDAIASDGVTYNVYADPKGANRPWELDLLPLILPADEWRNIAAAVAERAELLDAVLRDLYGAQTLLSEGLVPPALVFGQRSFLWPLQGVAMPGGVALHLYAADLARSPDGRWWILGDRTRGPSGAGYALQNRITLSRAFPDAFRELHVEPLAPFFAALQDSVYRLAATNGDAPLAVLLTPGPYNETYFEHSFLARFLGFPLVEGQDLIVRGDRVFLKTLRGLRRVHAILRRLDDDYCDPVELRADSALGVPGLLHAIRAGNVVVANALGSALLETGAFSGFYPAISQRWFGRDLALSSIATWWCGEAPALDYVIAHLDELVIKPAYPSMQMEPLFCHTLDETARAELVTRLRAQPHAYVAQEWVRLSHTPAFDANSDALVSRATTLRVFAVATAEGYRVLPGGLTRVAPHDGDVVSMQWGGSSKDTWVLADAPVVRIPLRRPSLGVEDVTESVVEIASRVGENLFWMGRYAERCEALARLLRAALVRLADATAEEEPALESIAGALDRLEVFPAKVEVDFVAAVVDPELPGGLNSNVSRLVASANQVRERMSTDNWHVIHRLQQRLPAAGTEIGPALEALDEVMLACVSLAGFAMDDMTRDESWQFLLLGRRLERLGHLCGLIAHVVSLGPEQRGEALEWLLEAANSIVTFRARFRRGPELLPVLHLVVFDAQNPHAVAFQLRELASILDRIGSELDAKVSGEVLAPLSRALEDTTLRGFDPEHPELETACAQLATLLERIEHAAYALSDDLQRQFFTHTATPAPVGIGAP